MTRPYVIDVFCGEGGASRGYADAGYNVVGVDNNPECVQHYPFSMFLGDWRKGLNYWLSRLPDVVLLHFSPPCQAYSKTARLHPAIHYPDLIPEVRPAAIETDIHYIIENVPEAPLENPTYLCGSMFPELHGHWKEQFVGLDRKRGFETSFPLSAPLDCFCDDQPSVPVYGHGRPGNGKDLWRGKGFAKLTKEVMGINWMSRDGLTEAIPPAYTEYIAYSYQAWRGQMIHVPDRSPEQRHALEFL